MHSSTLACKHAHTLCSRLLSCFAETDEWIDNTQNVRVSTLRLLASLPPAQRVRAARLRRTATLYKP
ncbi:hypothetical protein DUNSADRAFT_1513 [Dunaliella salina]|uniref:Uncharacterized protein n=1 Tax=Dunaliella salina TaxID=3046 RepID=A0ABQ7GWY0_DUNSA|nr:hypothetical protein DUNSADRAFT_1513 [Dunaliella salina]|eukprot:KAF5839115.1 hypothetical protein DUNSADRAFT_1513 [Dunaliella salina]